MAAGEHGNGQSRSPVARISIGIESLSGFSVCVRGDRHGSTRAVTRSFIGIIGIDRHILMPPFATEQTRKLHGHGHPPVALRVGSIALPYHQQRHQYAREVDDIMQDGGTPQILRPIIIMAQSQPS